MRKAKIMLSAIALFAVVGGAFAFEASRSASRLYYLTSPSDTGVRKTATATTATALGAYTIATLPAALFYTTTATSVTTTVTPYVAPAGN